MKTTRLAATALALLCVSACNRGNEEQLGNDVELNAVEQDEQSEDLNALSNQAADVAREAEALQNQAAALDQEMPATENATGLVTPEDENIQGM